MKRCNGPCGEVKHANQFRGREWVCKKCRSEQRKHLRRVSEYGLTFEAFTVMLDAQQGRCAICREEFDGEPDVDHDHKTRKVRGLLCHHCNTGLGLFRDNVTRLARAIEYLTGRQGRAR